PVSASARDGDSQTIFADASSCGCREGPVDASSVAGVRLWREGFAGFTYVTLGFSAGAGLLDFSLTGFDLSCLAGASFFFPSYLAATFRSCFVVMDKIKRDKIQAKPDKTEHKTESVEKSKVKRKKKLAPAKQLKSNPVKEKSSKPAPAPKPKVTQVKPAKPSPAKHSQIDQFILQRRTPAMEEASTGPSLQPQDDASANIVCESPSLAEAETGADTDKTNSREEKTVELDQGQAGSDSGKTPESRPLTEQVFIDEDQARPDSGESRAAHARLNRGGSGRVVVVVVVVAVKIDHMVKDFKLYEYNPGMETIILSEDDRRRSKNFMENIREIPKYHGEDGNPARANIKQALGR
nr:hypothetical protein [Tanacetum cinerariifolium]